MPPNTQPERETLNTGSPIELQKQQALDLVKRRYNLARQANSLDFERFSRFYKLFRNKQVYRNYQGLANLFIPEPYRIVRKKTAKLANAIKKVKVNAEHETAVEAAKIATHLLNFIRRKLNWFITERTAIQESRILGLAFLKLVWNVDKEELNKPWKGFDLTFHSADEILWAPETTIADIFAGNARWCIHQYETTLDSLKANPNYDPQSLEILQMRGGSAPKTDRTQLEQARLNWVHHNKLRDTKTKKFKIYEYWGKYNPENPDENNVVAGLDQDWLIVVADNTILLRAGLNPYAQLLENPIPIVPVPANPVGQELYPVGDIEPAESLFQELNDTRNQRMDTVTLNIDPPKEIVKAAGINEKELIARRGWIIHSNIPNGIRFVPPDMQGVIAAINEEKAIRGDIAQVTGVLDFSPESNVQAGISIDTARGAVIAKGEADVQTNDEIEILKTSLRMLYRIALAYSQVFLDRQFALRVVEQGMEKFYNIDKSSIQGNLDLDIEMETLQDTTTRQQLALLMLNTAIKIPGANVGKAYTDALEVFKEDVNIQEYYQQPQPAAPEPPKVSISLKGDLNPVEADEIFKTIPGIDKTATDPLLREELRNAMRGILPEHHKAKVQELDLQQKQKDLGQQIPTLPEV